MDDELNIYNWSGLIPDEVIKDFEQKYNVRVTYDLYSSNEELLSKMQTFSHGYDVIFPAEYMTEIMIKQGLLEKLDFKHIPNHVNIDSSFRKPFYDATDDYSLPLDWCTTGIAINTKKVKNVKESWDILFDERFKGKISILDDMRFGLVPALIKLGYSPNSTNATELEKAKQLMIAQKDLVKAYSSDTYTDLIKSGEVWIAYGYSMDLLKVARETPNIQYILPQEGTLKSVDTMCIPKGSKHKKTAEAFINYILDPQVHAKITNYSCATNPNKAALPYIDVKLKMNKNVFPDSIMQRRMIYLRDVGNATQLYDKVWNEIKNE